MDDEVALNDWPSWFPPEKKDELEDIAAIGYSNENVALYFGIKKHLFESELKNKNSRIKYHYERGILLNSATDAIEMMRASRDGNTTQGQRLDKLRYQVNFEQQKKKLIYGEDEDDI